jgi:hypothetical protein
VPESLVELADRMFVGPVWPASILVCLMVAYTLLAVVGLIDLGFDPPDLDLDPGIDLDPGLDMDVPIEGVGLDVAEGAGVDFLHGIGAGSIRATNFGRVPLVLWGGIFTVAFWSVSYGLWHTFESGWFSPPGWFSSSLLAFPNFVIAVMVTKGVTQPMLKHFVPPPKYGHEKLMGATCEICTIEATGEFGQAKFRTDAAPLLLNVRTDGPHIPKGTEVRIIGFDRDKRIYKVTHLQQEPTS